jgi:hypothetical protein
VETHGTPLDLSDEELELAVFHHGMHRLAAASSRVEEQYQAIDQLPTGLQWVIATMVLDMQVRNGGFHQFVWNPSRLLADHALEGLRQFGANRHASVVRQALDLAVEEWPQIRQLKTVGSLAAFSESARGSRLVDLDMEYYQEDDSELTAVRAAFIRSHPEECELLHLEPCYADLMSCPLIRQSR